MRTPVRKWENRVVSKRSTFELDEKSATGKDESLEDSATCLTPDVIAQEIDSQISLCSPFGLPVHVVRSSDLHCRRLGAVIRRSRACRSGLRRRIFGPLPLAAECSRAMPDSPALGLRAFRNRDNSDA